MRRNWIIFGKEADKVESERGRINLEARSWTDLVTQVSVSLYYNRGREMREKVMGLRTSDISGPPLANEANRTARYYVTRGSL